jgi:tRNA dimethylallyltransferase
VTGTRTPRGVLAVLGPTASGKTALSVALAERLGGEVLSADAFAVYRGLDAGTAKPTPGERRGVPHHFVDEREPSEPWSAGEFAREARRRAREILARGRLPILCGGTGFYVRAFFDGLFDGPTRDPRLRKALAAVAARRGAPFLHRSLGVLDPASAAGVLPNDAARSIRYLEIALSTGQRPSDLFRTRPGEAWDGPSVRLYLTLPRPVLYERISDRFTRLMASALPGEVRRLLDSGVPPDAPAFAAIGYRETVELLEGRIGEADWGERVVRATRRFAKRQETWFNAEEGLVRIPGDSPGVVDLAIAAAGPLLS